LLLGGRTLVQICEIHRKFKLRGSMAEWVAAAGLPGLCAARSVALRSSAMRPRRKTSLSGRVGGACSLDLEDAEPAGTTRSWRESAKGCGSQQRNSVTSYSGDITVFAFLVDHAHRCRSMFT
jgi:hypothetical protein